MASLAETSDAISARGRRPLRYVGDDRECCQDKHRNEYSAACAQRHVLHGLDLLFHGAVGYYSITKVSQTVDVVYAAEPVDSYDNYHCHEV